MSSFGESQKDGWAAISIRQRSTNTLQIYLSMCVSGAPRVGSFPFLPLAGFKEHRFSILVLFALFPLVVVVAFKITCTFQTTLVLTIYFTYTSNAKRSYP